ncbi:MAG TPA: SusC/RagA family TonB-linked outer membrane protein [Gemmatimonadaceae bacterium]|nr:SusC/RagA family TonB-linked outer membrane protein [Gemmatimonadaceae bacterium]
MSFRSVLHALALVAFFGTLAADSAVAQAPQVGTIAGRVTDASTGQPVVAAQIAVIGTTLGAQTNTDGEYTIRGVRAGSVELRALRVGYGEHKQTVNALAGQTVTADLRMAAVNIALTPIVSTATGDQRRIEIGNAIAAVDAPNVVATRAVSNMADLLTSRAAGVMVVPGTQTGAGTRVRIRGTSSLSLSNNPIYVIDGIRVQGATGSMSVGVGGTTPSRIGDLNPEEIESIEIVRGPSAATLYGTDAANGVIVITTKRGVAGRPRWSYYTEQTAITDRNDYPTAFRGWRNTSLPSNAIQCFLTQVASGACAQDSVTSYNLHKDPESTPFGVGYRQQHGIQLSGGSETVRYFLHGEWEDEDGVTKVPDFEKAYMAARGLSLLPEQRNPNHLNRISTRANVNIALPNNLDIGVSTGYITQDLRLPRSDDSGTPGIAANTYGGPGHKYNVNSAGDTLYGWREFTPRRIYQAQTLQSIERLTTSVASNWRPLQWLALRGNFGVDYIHRQDTQLCRFENCSSTTDRLGFKVDNRTNFFLYTVDAGATASRRLADDVESQTTAGIQFTRDAFTRNGARGSTLPPGAVTVTAGAVTVADETNSESRTLGGFLEQRVAWRDRLFLTGAVRSDRNSAFGADFKTAFYPKLSASWVLSEEPFFPELQFVNQLRLRSAYGASGVQPGTTDAVQFFGPTTNLGESGEQPGLVFSTLGNANLKPERSTEIEIGFDLTAWDSRASAELTYYNKSSRDALISRILPPSLGTGATARFENLGEVRNSGWEALIDAQLIQSPSFGWTVTLTGSTNSNELVSLGGVPEFGSATIQQREGYPLNGWWSRRLLSFDDADGNGIITLSEIQVSDTAEYHGYSVPRHEIALTNGVDFWGRRVRVSAMIDYKGGHLVYNNSERIRCASRLNCEGLTNPEASLYDQARTVMVREHPSRSVGGFFEDGDFLRFRELSLSYMPADDWAARLFRGRNVVATLAARNLGILWTKYTGVDPEAFGTTGDSPSSFQAFAPPTYFSFRLTFDF